MTGSDIERESFRRIADLVDFSRFTRRAAEIAARIVHATGDIEIASDLIIEERAIDRILEGLASGSTVVSDVRMAAAGIAWARPVCSLDYARPGEGTRSYSGMKRLLELPEITDPVVIVGSAPTALRAAIESLSRRSIPAVIGFPVGFVDAVESKQALRLSGVPSISNGSRRGGSAMAAAALNALERISRGEYRLG